MSPPHVAIVLAALLGASPPISGDIVQQALPDAVAGPLLAANLPVPGDIVQQALPDAVAGPLLQALPPPPTIVVRDTYYGKISIDHPAHLKRRAACVSCHGPGKVRKIDFTPKVAHERCVGCHKEQAAGPTQCNGCHVKPPPASDLPEGVQVAARTDGATPSAAAPPGAVAASSAADASRSVAGGGPAGATAAEPREKAGALRRVLQVGWSAGTGDGPALRMSSRQGSFAVTHSFDRVVGATETRTLGLLGLGVALPLHGRWRTEAVALGGFDLVDGPRLAWMPAVGARAALEWSAQRWMLHNVQLSVTGVLDLSQRTSGRDVGTVFATISTGLTLPPR